MQSDQCVKFKNVHYSASVFTDIDSLSEAKFKFDKSYTVSLAFAFVKMAAKVLGPCVENGVVGIVGDPSDKRAYTLSIKLYELIRVELTHTSAGFAAMLDYGNGKLVSINSAKIWPDSEAKAFLRFVKHDVRLRLPNNSTWRRKPFAPRVLFDTSNVAATDDPAMAEHAERLSAALTRNFASSISEMSIKGMIESPRQFREFSCLCVYADFLQFTLECQPYAFGAFISQGVNVCVREFCSLKDGLEAVDWDDFCRRAKPRLDAFIPRKYLKVWPRIGTDYRNAVPGAATTLDAPLPPLPAAPGAAAFLAMLNAGMGTRVSGVETVKQTDEAFTVFFNAYDHFACRADWRDGRLQTRIVFDRPGVDGTCLVVEACQPWAEIDFSRYVAAVRARLELRLPDRFLAVRGWLADNGLFAKIKRLWN